MSCAMASKRTKEGWSSLQIRKASFALALAAVALGAAGRTWSGHFERKFTDVNTRVFLGFDRNDYPGDATLDVLRKTFTFTGYWLNAPPGESTTSWTGKRETLRKHGFGFLVLFNGRLDKGLHASEDARRMGMNDALEAEETARAEGFPRGTVIFLDQEEGGRMLPEQLQYLYAWVDGVSAGGYRAGIYCSGIRDNAVGGGVITAQDIRENAGPRRILLLVYNDACPPSPGCVFSSKGITPSNSEIAFASVWQIAQSPCRKNLTANCRETYSADGNCYSPGLARYGIFVDVDVATSADPSRGR